MGGVANSPEGCASVQRDLCKQSPVPGDRKTRQQRVLGGHKAAKQVGMKAAAGLGGKQVEVKAALCPCSRR